MLNSYDGLSRNAVPWSEKTLSVIPTPCNLFAVDIFHLYVRRHRCKQSDSIHGENSQNERPTQVGAHQDERKSKRMRWWNTDKFRRDRDESEGPKS